MAVEPDKPIAAPEQVHDDLYCAGCGYNLRTLLLDAVCPECATPVRESLISDVHRVWLRRVRRGLSWLIVAEAGGLLPLLLWLLTSWLGGGIWSMSIGWVWTGLLLALGVSFLIGVFRATVKPPYQS